MQGDIHRAKQKDRERLRDKPDFSRILTGVDDMRINDADNRDKYEDYTKQISFDEADDVRQTNSLLSNDAIAPKAVGEFSRCLINESNYTFLLLTELCKY